MTFDMRTAFLVLLSAFALSCEAIEGSIDVDGVSVSLLECTKISANTVVLGTDGTEKVRLKDGGADDTVSIGTGACLSRRMCGSGFGGINCDSMECVEEDYAVLSGCATIEISESGVSQSGEEALDVHATFNCDGQMRALSGTVDISNCL